MATTTTNLGLTKPAYADTADIAVINANMDKIDTAANGLEAGIAIVSNNNTHTAVSKGQYVYVRNHGTLSEGMYKANSNIAANGTLSNSNVTAVSGGLGADVASNADAITTLNSKTATMCNVKKGNIAANTSATIAITKPAFLSIARASVSASTTTLFIDQWDGRIPISTNANYEVSVSGENVTITNNSGQYCNYIILY